MLHNHPSALYTVLQLQLAGVWAVLAEFIVFGKREVEVVTACDSHGMLSHSIGTGSEAPSSNPVANLSHIGTLHLRASVDDTE